MPSALIPVRIKLHTGETTTVALAPTDTIAQLKAAVWKKKKFTEENMSDFTVCDVVNGDASLNDLEPLSALVTMRALFTEQHRDTDAKGKPSKSTEILEGRLIQKTDNTGLDRLKSKTPAVGRVQLQGTLFKLNKSSTLWNNRYFVLQDFQLYYFNTEKSFKDGEPALAVESLRMAYAAQNWSTKWDDLKAACASLPRSISSTKGFLLPNGCFSNLIELHLSSTYCGEANENGSRSKYILLAKSQEESTNWLNEINKLQIRHVKYVTMRCCEELRKRNALRSEGIFRLAGSNLRISALKTSFDTGVLDIDLTKSTLTVDDIAVCMKRTFRDMYEPLFTFSLYEKFVNIALAQDTDMPSQLRQLIKVLPASNYMLLKYLCVFLADVVAHSDENKMTAGNISVVFSPNILRSDAEQFLDSACLALLQLLVRQIDFFFAIEGSDSSVSTMTIEKCNILTCKRACYDKRQFCSSHLAKMLLASNDGRQQAVDDQRRVINELRRIRSLMMRSAGEHLLKTISTLDHAWENALSVCESSLEFTDIKTMIDAKKNEEYEAVIAFQQEMAQRTRDIDNWTSQLSAEIDASYATAAANFQPKASVFDAKLNSVTVSSSSHKPNATRHLRTSSAIPVSSFRAPPPLPRGRATSVMPPALPMRPSMNNRGPPPLPP
jgi:hypothetical protein